MGKTKAKRAGSVASHACEPFRYDYTNALWGAIKMLQKLEECLMRTQPKRFPKGFDSPDWHGCYNNCVQAHQKGLIVATLQIKFELLHPNEISMHQECVNGFQKTIANVARFHSVDCKRIQPPSILSRKASESQEWILSELVRSKTLKRECLLYDLVKHWINQNTWRECMTLVHERVATESMCALVRMASEMPGVDIHWKNEHGVSAITACSNFMASNGFEHGASAMTVCSHVTASDDHEQSGLRSHLFVDNLCNCLLRIAKFPGCRVLWEDDIGMTTRHPAVRTPEGWINPYSARAEFEVTIKSRKQYEDLANGQTKPSWNWGQAGVDALSRLYIDSYHIERPPFVKPLCILRGMVVPSVHIQRIVITNCTLDCSFKFLDDFPGLTHVRLQNNEIGHSLDLYHMVPFPLLPGRLQRYTQMDPRKILVQFYEMVYRNRADVTDCTPFGQFVKDVVTLPWDAFAIVMDFDVI